LLSLYVSGAGRLSFDGMNDAPRAVELTPHSR
jgi:hypothetical protein